ncbi:Mlp family lipoprotein [Borrelia puertoricensis]|uniref:Mlp family lipoprotein n=1 Tax=Borrelia puertoricensis TaxID=2756107 RepID=UPI001FF3FA07|nr:Mlp family lipoprotein [Borrelia puertoricensis]UPA18367.1 Mlp family lipoprotein [Borrelia puertoricensis]
MNKINFILVLALLISSCEYEHGNATPKSRVKRNLEEQEEVQKTPEDALREKLNDTQKQGLDFLKDALGDDSILNKILSADESKIKEALDHIQSELAKCTGDDASEQKKTFKEVVKGALNGGENLDKFKDQAASNCNGAGAGG